MRRIAPPHLPPVVVTTALAAVVLLANAAVPRPPEALGLAGAVALWTGAGAAGLALARRLLPAAGPAISAAVAAGVFGTLLLTLPATLLGHFGLLDPRLFLGLEAVLVVVVAVAVPRRGRGEHGRAGETRAGEARAGEPAATPAGPPASAPAPSRPLEVLVRVRRAAVVAAVFLAALLLLVLLRAERYEPVHRLDDPSYHLIGVATWIQHQDLRMPKFAWGDHSTPFYPLNGDLLVWTLVAPFRDSDFLARWAQVPFFAGLVLATLAVARRLGASWAAAGVAVAVLLTVRRLSADLALSAANDVVAAFLAVAAVDALLAWGRHRPPPGPVRGPAPPAGAPPDRPPPEGGLREVPGAAVFFGTALGLFLGTKYLAVLMGAPLVLAALLLPWLGRVPVRSHPAALAVGGAAAAVAGGYTYLRNLWTLGNPLFPHPVELGVLSLPGWEHTTLAVRRHLPEFALDPVGYLLDPVLHGELFRFTLLPAALLAPLLALALRLRRRGGGDGWLGMFVLALPAVQFLVFVYQVHDHRDVRYLFAAVALAAAALAWLLESLARRHRGAGVALGTAVAVAAFLLQLPRGPGDLPLALALGVATLVAGDLLTGSTVGGRLWVRGRRRLRRHPVAVPGTAALLLVAACLAMAPTARYHAEHKYDDDPVVRALEREAPEGTVVAVAGGNRWYPLYGSRLQNRVVVIPSRPPLEDGFYRWGRSAQPRIHRPDRWGYRGWRRQLLAAGAEMVAIHAERGGEQERQWVASRPHHFERVTFHGDLELWRVLDGGTPAPAGPR